MIDVSMGDDDLGKAQLMLLQDGQDPGDVVTGIDHNCLASVAVTQDAAIALQHPNREGLSQQSHDELFLLRGRGGGSS